MIEVLPHLYTIEEVAEALRLSRSRCYTLRKQDDWPCVAFGAHGFRFTREHVEQIILLYTKTPPPPRNRRSRLK